MAFSRKSLLALTLFSSLPFQGCIPHSFDRDEKIGSSSLTSHYFIAKPVYNRKTGKLKGMFVPNYNGRDYLFEDTDLNGDLDEVIRTDFTGEKKRMRIPNFYNYSFFWKLGVGRNDMIEAYRKFPKEGETSLDVLSQLYQFK